jgi:glycosyltransferase involved in cell wall biosynthesis
MEKHFSQAWIQVIPSRWSEPFGMVAIEAMIRGTAVIATDTGGLREIIDDGETGILIPVDNVSALTNALKYLVENNNITEEMGKKARYIAQNKYNQTLITNQFLNLYHSILTM